MASSTPPVSWVSEISADPLNPLDPIKKVVQVPSPPMRILSILDRAAYRRAVISTPPSLKSGEPYITTRWLFP